MRKAGEYTDYLRLQSQAVTVDEVGQPEEGFTPDTYLWGQLVDGGSTITEEANRRACYRLATINLRGFPAVVALDRLTECDGTEWLIQSVSKDKDGLILDCISYA